jgi:cation:H+ antiporter
MAPILGDPVDLLYLFLGLLGLLVGAEMAVGGSLGLAKVWGWPSWVAGVILLALGTSLPEFFVAVASAPEYPGLALGTVFGSNAINVGGVFGLMLVLQRSEGIPLRDARPATLIALLLGCALAFGAFGGTEVHRLASLGMLALFAAVLWSSLKGGAGNASATSSTLESTGERNGESEFDRDRIDLAEFVVGDGSDASPAPIWRSALLAISGFALLAVASKGFLIGALSLAETLGWGTGFAGFLIAAAGTSAPELFTSVQAMRKGHSGAVFGNVLGSNAFNLLLVGGTTGILARAPIDPVEIHPQLWINLAACAVLALPTIIPRKGGRRTRAGVWGGVVLIVSYVAAAYWIGMGSASV